MRSLPRWVVALGIAIAASPVSLRCQARAPAPLGPPAVRVARLEVPDSATASSGIISPDGSLFLYGVVRQGAHALYLLDVRSGRSRRIVASSGDFVHIAWSPDGKRIAYWLREAKHGVEDRRASLRVAALDGSEERPIDSLPAELGYLWPMPITWMDDDRIVTGYYPFTLQVGAEPVTLMARRSTGEPAPVPDGESRWITGSGLSHSGMLVYMGTCCGGSHAAIHEFSAGGDRCIAGPAPTTDEEFRWDERRHRVYFVSADWRDSGRTTLYAIDRAARGAQRITLPGFRIWGSSMSDAGDLWFTDEGTAATARELWVIPADTLSKYVSASDPLLGCPPLQSGIEALVRSTEFGKEATIDEVYRDPSRDLTMFVVAREYRQFEYYRWSRVGMKFADRIGWVDSVPTWGAAKAEDSTRADPALFRLLPSDGYLMGPGFDSALSGQPEARDAWRSYLASSPAMPPEQLLDLARKDAARLAPAVLRNPRVAGDSLPFHWYLRLAGLHRELALATLRLPSIARDPERLARIADLPRYRADLPLFDSVTSAFRADSSVVAQRASELSESAALHGYLACVGTPGCDATVRALILERSVARNGAVLALAVGCSERPHDGKLAPWRVTGSGQSAQQLMFLSVQRAYAGGLPPSLPRIVLRCGGAPGNWRAADAISRFDERYRAEREQALLQLASDDSTPDSLLRVIARVLPIRVMRDLGYGVGLQAERRKGTVLLREIARLDTMSYKYSAQGAQRALDRIAGKPEPPRPMPPRPPPAPRPPSRGAASSPKESASAAPISRQRLPPPPPRFRGPSTCLPPDAWSGVLEQALRGVATLVTADSLCQRALVALDSAFTLAPRPDSIYLFATAGGFSAAMRPFRVQVDVTLVAFDTNFVERGRRIVRLP